MKPLFQKYWIADYSGGGENHEPQQGIAVYRAVGGARPRRVYPKGQRYFSRDRLREHILREVALADRSGHRVLFGLDHQFSWPDRMWRLAGLGDRVWREALRCLYRGDGQLPPLDIPRRYCRAFNRFAGETVFWVQRDRLAESYGIPKGRAPLSDKDRYRSTEQALFTIGFAPKPADAVGGQGLGVVGGQTICGLTQIARLLDCERIAWWPFDGLEFTDRSYQNRHMAVEIYPAMFVPDNVKKSDANDAYYTCLAVQQADRTGLVHEWMSQKGFYDKEKRNILKEGWILGVLPRNE